MWELMKGELKKSDANKQNFISDTWKKEGRVFNQFLHMVPQKNLMLPVFL